MKVVYARRLVTGLCLAVGACSHPFSTVARLGHPSSAETRSFSVETCRFSVEIRTSSVEIQTYTSPYKNTPSLWKNASNSL